MLSYQAILAFSALVTIQVAFGIIYKFASRGSSGYDFSQASSLAISELFKLCLSLGFLYSSKSGYQPVGEEVKEEAVPLKVGYGMCLLSLLYAFNNHTAFYLFKLADPGTINLVKSGSTFISAFILWGFMNRKTSTIQWLAIVIKVMGLVASQYDECKGASSYHILFYILLFLATTITAFCGCLYDYLSKSTNASLHAMNVWLYASGFLINMTYYTILKVWINPEEPSFFYGFRGWGLGVVICNSLIGLAMTAVFKYADAVVKCIAQSTSTAILLVLSVFFFGVPFRIVGTCGCIIIFIATYLYFTNPPPPSENKPKPIASSSPLLSASDKTVISIRGKKKWALFGLAGIFGFIIFPLLILKSTR